MPLGYETAFMQAPVGIAIVDLEGRWSRVNQRFCELTGYSEAELLGRAYAEITHPDDLGRDRQRTREMLAGELDRYSQEKRYIRPDGKELKVLLEASIVREQDGTPLHYVAHVRETSERKPGPAPDARDRVGIEQALELQAEIIANMAEGVCLVTIGEDPRIVYANPSFEETLGYEPGSLQGTPAGSVFEPPDRSRSEQAAIDEAAEAIGTDGNASAEIRCVRRDGGEIWCRISSSSFDHPEHGAVWVMVAQEITRQRAAREAWAEVERSKNHFFSSVSHELRTPLTSILGYTALLRRRAERLPPDERDYVGVIERNAERLLRLVEDLLAVARAQAGDFELEPAPIELDAVVREAAEALRPAAEEKGIELLIEEPVAPTAMVGDEDRLAQVVGNLVSNAVKYTPEGGRIELELSPEGSNATLLVSDTGIGIGPEARTQVFERLYRDGGAMPSEQGAGLGLAISKAIVEAHSGEIAVRRTGPEGTTVAVTLPMRGT